MYQPVNCNMQGLFWTKHVPACTCLYTETFFTQSVFPYIAIYRVFFGFKVYLHINCYIQGLFWKKVYLPVKGYIQGLVWMQHVPAYKLAINRMYSLLQNVPAISRGFLGQNIYLLVNGYRQGFSLHSAPSCTLLSTGTFWDSKCTCL